MAKKSIKSMLKNKLVRGDAITKMQKGQFSDVSMSMDWSWYDSLRIEAGKVAYRFFSTSQGQEGKTEAETNLKTPSEMPQGHQFLCHGIKVMYLGKAEMITKPEDIHDINSFFWNSIVHVNFTGKDSMGTWSLFELLGMSAAFVYKDLNDVSDYQQPQQTWAQYKNIFPLNFPILFPAKQNFTLDMNLNCGAVPASVADSFVRIALNGELQRLV